MLEVLWIARGVHEPWYEPLKVKKQVVYEEVVAKKEILWILSRFEGVVLVERRLVFSLVA